MGSFREEKDLQIKGCILTIGPSGPTGLNTRTLGDTRDSSDSIDSTDNNDSIDNNDSSDNNDIRDSSDNSDSSDNFYIIDSINRRQILDYKELVNLN